MSVGVVAVTLGVDGMPLDVNDCAFACGDSRPAPLVTVVTPLGKVLPLGELLTKFVTPQLSVALTTKVTLLRLHWPASAVNTRLLEQASTGF